MHLQKQQSAVELLTTYAWAFLIVAVFIAAVAVLATTRPPAAYLASSCNIQPLLPCSQTLLTTNAVSNQRFVVQFTNNLGTSIQFAANAINLTTTNIGNPGVSHFLGNCTPSFATPGAQVLCTVPISGTLRPSPGTQTSTSFTLTYNICNGNKPSTCQAASYKSTGLSTQNAAPSNINFFTLNIITQPSTGSVILNGVTYPNGVNAVYIPGNYVIFGVPPSGYRFNTWQVTGASTLSSTSLQSATLSLSSNGTLTANFIHGATTTTVTFITTSTSTTSVTSTSSSITSTSSTTTSTSTTSTSTSTSSSSTTSTSTSTSTTSVSTTIHYIYCISGYEEGPLDYYASISPSNGALGAWTATTSYPVSSILEGASCVINNGYIYCVGGYNGGPMTNVYSAPVSTSGGIGTWSATTSFPIATYGQQYQSCVTLGNEIACTPGISGTTATYYATLSSGTVGSWSSGSALPSASNCAVVTSGGYIYCIYGHYFASLSSGIGSWSSTTAYPIGGDNPTCTGQNSYVYCVAGFAGGALTQTYYASLSSSGIGTWSATTSYPFAAYGFSCASTSSYIYCVGSDTGGVGVVNVYYAPISSSGIGTWTAATSYPKTSRYTTCAIS